MKKGLLVLAAAAGLALGFILGALRSAGFWPAAVLPSGGAAPGEPSLAAWAGPLARQAPPPPLSPQVVQSLVAIALEGGGLAGSHRPDGSPPSGDPAGAAGPIDAVVDRHVLMGDVVPGGGDEVILGITRASGDGLVAVFQRAGPSWRLVAKSGGFGAIDRIEVRALTGADSGELLVYDDHDQLTGAFYRRRAVTILKWRNGVLVPVWSETLYEELYSLDPPLAEREITAVDVRFGAAELVVRGEVARSRRLPDGTYRDLERTPVEARWRWDSGRFRFVGVAPR
ncbi:MAG TPA: hypothetical protein VIK93_01055 [Limnochordales bacterium]